MDRLRFEDREMHMVFHKDGRPLYWTAARKQSEAIAYFLEDRGGTWEGAVEHGYRAMKCFYEAICKTYESLPKEVARELLPRFIRQENGE